MKARLEALLPQIMNLKPRGIREHLDLNKPIFARTAAYGHFGRDPEADGGFSWEKTDLADKIKAAFTGSSFNWLHPRLCARAQGRNAI